MDQVKIRKLPQAGPNRTIATDVEDQPLMVVMGVRASSTAHGRMKVAFGVPMTDDDGQPAFGAFAEFRLEMN